MKKIVYLLLIPILLFSCDSEEEIIDVNAEEKFDWWNPAPLFSVFSYINATSNECEEVYVGRKDYYKYLNDANYQLGRCSDTFTYVPDDIFEHRLIREGLDDKMDNYVLTSNIVNVESLAFSYVDYPGFDLANNEIEDFTGIEDFKSLKSLYSDSSEIRKIDLTHNSNLKFLGLYALNTPPLNEINLSKNLALKTIILEGYHNINTLDLSENSSLVTVGVYDFDRLKSLIISDQAKVNSVAVEQCNLLANFSFETIHYKAVNRFVVSYCPRLKCISVASPFYSSFSTKWRIPSHASFSKDCKYSPTKLPFSL